LQSDGLLQLNLLGKKLNVILPLGAYCSQESQVAIFGAWFA